MARVLALLGAGFLLTVPVGATPPPNYGGSYTLAAAHGDREFSLQVQQTGTRARINFSAAMNSGTGAAPEAQGKGRVSDGVLSFKFEDSFHNEGTCTLQPNHGAYQLNMTVTKVVEASPFHFYGQLVLKKISDRVLAP